MASREELMQSIRPGMNLTKDFFKRIYGYEITWPGFAEKAIRALELVAGCGRAREHYTCVTAEIEAEFDKVSKVAAAWYVKECEKQFEELKKKRGEEQRKQITKEYLQTMSDRELLMFLRKSRP